MRKPTQGFFRPQTDAFECLLDLPARLALGTREPEALEWRLEHMIDSIERIECFVRILENRLDFTPELASLGCRHGGDGLAAVEDLARCRFEKAHHEHGQGGF